MKRLAEDTQEAFLSGNPDNLEGKADGMLQEMEKEMADIQQRVLERPGILSELVLQLHQGDIQQKMQAAEMLFCVVGQGAASNAAATQQALQAGMLDAVLSVLQDIATRAPADQRSKPALQQFTAILIGILAQVTQEDPNLSSTEQIVSKGGVKLMRRLFETMSGDGAQQNVVSMLWHWSARDVSIREQVMAVGIAEMQSYLLSPQHSPVQRKVAADQLAAYVSVPNQQEFDAQDADSTLAEDLINAGAPVALVDMLNSNQHASVRCSAASALAVLGTFSPKSKLKMMAAGAFTPVVAMLAPSAPNDVREAGAMLLITLVAGDPREGPVFTQTEAVVQFAGIGAITGLAIMLRPGETLSVRIMAIEALAVMASSFDNRVQKALVSSGVVSLLLDLLRVLRGGSDWDPTFDELEVSTLKGMQIKSAEIVASVGINDANHCRMLVDTGAIPEIVVACADPEQPEQLRDHVMKLVNYLCQTDEDILAILSAMQQEAENEPEQQS